MACGLLMDIIGGGIIGLSGLLFMFIGIFTGLVCKRYLSNHYIVAAGVTAAATLVYEIFFFLLRFAVWGKGGFLVMLVKVIIPECLYTAVMAVPVYLLIKLVIRQLKTGDEV